MSSEDLSMPTPRARMKSSVQLLKRVSSAFTVVNDIDHHLQDQPSTDILSGTLIAKAAYHRHSSRSLSQTSSRSLRAHADDPRYEDVDALVQELQEKSELLELAATMGNRVVEELTAAYDTLQTMEQEKQELELKLSEAYARISGLQSRVDDIEHTHAVQQSQEQEKDYLMEQRAHLAIQLQSARDALRQERAISKQQATRIEELEGEVVDLLAAHEAEVRALQQEVQSATLGRTHAQLERDQLKVRISHLQHDIENLQTTLANVTRVDCVSPSHTYSDSEYLSMDHQPVHDEELQAQCESLQAALAQLDNKYQDVCSQLTTSAQRHYRLQQSYQLLETRTNTLQVKCSVLEGEKTTLEHRLEYAEQLVQKTRDDEIQAQFEQKDTGLRQMSQRISQLESEITQLKAGASLFYDHAPSLGFGTRVLGAVVVCVSVCVAAVATRTHKQHSTFKLTL